MTLDHLISTTTSDGIHLRMSHTPYGWEVSATRPLGDRPHRPEAPKTYTNAVGYASDPDLAIAITIAAHNCWEDFEVLTWTPTTSAPTLPQPETLAAILANAQPPTKPQAVRRIP